MFAKINHSLLFPYGKVIVINSNSRASEKTIIRMPKKGWMTIPPSKQSTLDPLLHILHGYLHPSYLGDIILMDDVFPLTERVVSLDLFECLLPKIEGE